MKQRRPLGRRCAAGAALTTVIGLGLSSPALAHTEFDLDEVAPGSIVSLHLFVENESSTAGTTTIELRFPQPIVIVELPETSGWTAEAVEGTVGEEAIGVLWSRPTAGPGEDPNLPLTIGPLPANEGRLQFKVVQTYSDGQIDRWIEDWPQGAPEPQTPGPVLDLVIGAPGTIPETTASATTVAEPVTTQPSTTESPTTAVESSSPTSTTVTSTTIAAADTTIEATAAPSTTDTSEANEDDDSSATGIVIALAVIALVIAGMVIVLLRRRR